MENVNIPDYMKEDVIDEMIGSGIGLDVLTQGPLFAQITEEKLQRAFREKGISPDKMWILESYYGSEEAAKYAVLNKSSFELKNAIRTQSNKEQDALYDMGGELSDEDQQMVDTIASKWRDTSTKNLGKYQYATDSEFLQSMYEVQDEYNKMYQKFDKEKHMIELYKEFENYKYGNDSLVDNASYSVLDGFDGDTGVYFVDITHNIGPVPVGTTYVINTNEGWIADYSHIGVGPTASASPISGQPTRGVVNAKVKKPEDYTKFFLEYSVTPLLYTVSGASSILDKKGYGNVRQSGAGYDVPNLGASGGLSYYSNNGYIYMENKTDD